ncbi:MAG TPA: rod shape-determining protein MreD, partial [Woeseiaceae bacterium]|nr:rod shape-determining protein MreD [Woeseiaceae bacterium]
MICIIMALMLAIVPMPALASPWRPDWVALTLIYWSISMPRTYSVGTAWIVGIVLDVAHGTLLGQHALALAFITYLT